MFKKTLIVLVIMALSFSFTDLVKAEEAVVEEKGPLSISLRGNVLSDLECGESDFGFGIAAEYELPWYDLSIEAAIDRLNFFDNERVQIISSICGFPIAAVSSAAEFDSTDLSLSLKYNFRKLEDISLVPYVLGGIGVMFNDYSIFDVDTSLETHVGAGLDYLINEDWSVYGEVRYLWSRAEVPDWYTYPTGEEYKMDLDSLIGMVGMKYTF